MSKYNKIINNELVKKEIIKLLETKFNAYYDHNWIELIYLNKSIDSKTNYIYFKNNYIQSILEEDLYNETILNKVLEDIIEFIKNNNIKLSIYYLPDILKLDIDCKILYCNQKQKDISNIIQYIRKIPEKVLLIDFLIKNENIFFYIKNEKFFECNIKDIEQKLDYIFSKYREIEQEKTKILMIYEYNKYYDCNFVNYMFNKGFWIDFCDDEVDFLSDIMMEGNQYNFYYYYDIILYNNSSGQYLFKIFNNSVEKKLNHNFKMMENKMFIVQKNYPNFDIHPVERYKYDLSSEFNKFIYYSKTNILNEDIVSKCRLRPFVCENIHPVFPVNEYVNNIENKCIMCDLGLQKLSYNNDTVLSKENFFRNYGLDLDKKLVTIFIQWPQTYDGSKIIGNTPIIKEHGYMWYSKLEYDFLTNTTFLLNLCKSFEKKNCNIIFKSHPWQGMTITDKVNFYNTDEKIDLLEKINFIHKQFKFVDNTYANEIHKYSDYSVLIGPTSVGLQTYIYNIPSLCISTKNEDYDWFKAIELYMKEYYYGIFEYYEDMIDNIDDKVNNFLTTNHTYKYYENNPFYGDTYFNDYEKLGNKMIELIKNNKNLKITNKKQKNIKLLLDPSNITVYDKSNIEFDIMNDIISLKINNVPSKSHGISINVFENYENNKFKLTLECKLEKEEDNIHLRIYTGEKWIEIENTISTTYQKFNVCDDFNFYNRSKWRISTTSKTIGQILFINNIHFIHI